MKIKIQLIHTILATLVIFSNAHNPYCRVKSCPPGKHTLCLYPGDRPAAACGTVIRSGLTDDEREAILDMHNVFRGRLHSGAEIRVFGGKHSVPVPHIPLVWDYGLEFAAQRWANQCKNSTDICRNMHNTYVGQSMKLVDGKGEEDIDLPIWDWYRQVARFDGRIHRYYDPVVGGQSGTNEYTQMVWRETFRIGCGAVSFFAQNTTQLLFACNYEPGGSIKNYPVY